MYFSLPQLFVFLFDVLSVAVFVIRDRFVKKSNVHKSYPCVIKNYLIFFLSLFTSVRVENILVIPGYHNPPQFLWKIYCD